MVKPVCHAEKYKGFLDPYVYDKKYLSKCFCKKLRNKQIRQHYKDQTNRELKDELLNSDFELLDDWIFYETYGD